jgi:cytochrome b
MSDALVPATSASPPAAGAAGKAAPLRPRVRVWDLPTRLFHWTLALLVAASFVTAEIGGNAMLWHMRVGYAILALVLFRVLWGLAGDRYALFSSFVRGPRRVQAYLGETLRGLAPRTAGHNPLGAVSVLALLAALAVQAITGLFANDDIATEGPLAKLVSGGASTWLTRLHKWNETLIVVLVGLHLAAIVFYALGKRENLVWPMIIGDKLDLAAWPAADDLKIRIRAAVLLALAAGLVTYLVRL